MKLKNFKIIRHSILGMNFYQIKILKKFWFFYWWKQYTKKDFINESSAIEYIVEHERYFTLDFNY